MRIKNNPYLTARAARAILDYDPATGRFAWRARQLRSPTDRRTQRWNETHAGCPAGHVDDLGVTRISIFSRSYLASRLAWLITKGRWPRRKLIYRDGNARNLRIANMIMRRK